MTGQKIEPMEFEGPANLSNEALDESKTTEIALSPEEVKLNQKIWKRRQYLALSFVLFRVIIVLVLIPMIHAFWNKKSHPHDLDLNYFDKAISYLKSFDAEHMIYVSRNGYAQEKNHAFFPMFPMVLATISQNFGEASQEFVGLLFQLIIGAANSVLLYNFGLKILNNEYFAVDMEGLDEEAQFKIKERAELISFGAAVLYNFNQTLVYTISLYSESFFILMTLIAFNLLHFGNDSKLQTKRQAFSNFFLVIATCTRSTGLLSVIVPLYLVAHKSIQQWFKLTKPGTKEKTGCCNRCRRFNKSVKLIYQIFSIVDLVGLLPILTVTVWKPYEMYCLSRLDTYHEVPNWCFDRIPNVYDYIQKVYWDVGFGGFANRPWYLTLVSMFTNQLFIYMIYRTLQGQGIIKFFTLSLFDTVSRESKDRKANVFQSQIMLPHAYIFLLNMLIVFLIANMEINSRVASTCPFYFLAFSQLIIETKEELVKKEASGYKHAVVLISLIYNSVVLVLNLVLFTVEIGFI